MKLPAIANKTMSILMQKINLVTEFRRNLSTKDYSLNYLLQ